MDLKLLSNKILVLMIDIFTKIYFVSLNSNGCNFTVI